MVWQKRNRSIISYWFPCLFYLLFWVENKKIITSFQCVVHRDKQKNEILTCFFCFLFVSLNRIIGWSDDTWTKPSLHLHPTACQRIWPLIGQMQHTVYHCDNACGVRLLVSFFLSPALSWLGALRAPHSSNAHPLRICRECIPLGKMGPPMDSGALRTCCAFKEGRCWAGCFCACIFKS